MFECYLPPTSTAPRPITCGPNMIFVNSTCQPAKHTAGYIDSLTMLPVTPASASVAYYSSTGILDCAINYQRQSSSACIEQSCIANQAFISGACFTVTPYCVLASAGTCSVCKDGFYVSGSTCTACYGSCSKCTGPLSTDCTTCAPGF